MTLIIAGHVIDPEGTACVGVDVQIAFDNAASFADLGGDWDTQGRYGLSIPTSTFGAWSWTVPFSAIDPSTTTCSITLPNGVRWSGLLPLSHNGTLSLKDLKDSYSWGLVSAPSASVVAVQGPAGADGASGTSLPGVIGDGLTPGGMGVDGRLLTGSLATAARASGLEGLNPDPTYNPTHTYTSDDASTGGSFYGSGSVYFETWTPTRSGAVTLLPPDTISAVVNEIDYYVFAGSVIGTDVPSLDGSGTHGAMLADSWHGYNGTPGPPSIQTFHTDSFAVTAGQVYTVAVAGSYLAYPGSAVGDIAPLGNWHLSTQGFGGQSPLKAWVRPTGDAATAIGRGTLASGDRSLATGEDGIASGDASLVSGRGSVASAQSAVALGDGNTVSGLAAFAAGEANDVSGEGASAVGLQNRVSGTGARSSGLLNDVSGTAAAADGQSNVVSGNGARSSGNTNTVSGASAAADGDANIVSGDAAQAMHHNNRAPGDRSLAMGHRAIAALAGELAHGSGYNTFGNAQYSRLVGHVETPDAIPVSLTLDAGVGAVAILVPDGQTWQVMAQVSATRHDVPGTVATFLIKGAVAAAGGAARLVGSPTIETWADADASTWVATLAVSGANLELLVTGEAAQTVYWFGTLHLARIAA